MSQRLGMADGRCFTINYSNELLTEMIAKNAGLNILDSYKVRQFFQNKDDIVEPYLQKGSCGIRNLNDYN